MMLDDDRPRRPNMRRLAIEWIIVAALFLFVLVLCAAPGQTYALDQPSACQVAVQNVNAVRAKTAEVLARAKLASARRLASLTAREAAGFYTAMRTLVPVACPDKEAAAAIDYRLQQDIDEMRDYADRNW